MEVSYKSYKIDWWLLPPLIGDFTQDSTSMLKPFYMSGANSGATII